MPAFPKVGVDALLTPENCAVLLIDHQPSQLANVNSHDPTLVINNDDRGQKSRSTSQGQVWPCRWSHRQLSRIFGIRWRSLQRWQELASTTPPNRFISR
jgi:hypothetical protein